MKALLLISRHEVKKILVTRRGWLAMFGFGLIWTSLLMTVIRRASEFMTAPETGAVANALLEHLGFSELSQWPVPELAIYWLVSLFLLPLFSLVISADQIASDKTRGTLRYLALRASRTDILFGRFLGQWLIQLLLVALTLASVLVLIAMNSPEQLIAAGKLAPMITTNLMLVLMPYVALMSCVSAVARSARQATLLAVTGWVLAAIVITWVQTRFGPFGWLDWTLPGSQIPSLLKLTGWQTLNLASIPIIHTVCLLTLGWWIMRRINL